VEDADYWATVKVISLKFTSQRATIPRGFRVAEIRVGGCTGQNCNSP
jgi:hypothetical protein